MKSVNYIESNDDYQPHHQLITIDNAIISPYHTVTHKRQKTAGRIDKKTLLYYPSDANKHKTQMRPYSSKRLVPENDIYKYSSQVNINNSTTATMNNNNAQYSSAITVTKNAFDSDTSSKMSNNNHKEEQFSSYYALLTPVLKERDRKCTTALYQGGAGNLRTLGQIKIRKTNERKVDLQHEQQMTIKPTKTDKNIERAMKTIDFMSRNNDNTVVKESYYNTLGLKKPLLGRTSTRNMTIRKTSHQQEQELETEYKQIPVNSQIESELEYKIQKRPMTPIRHVGGYDGTTDHRPSHAFNKKKQSHQLFNQNVIDYEKFRIFMEYKVNNNDFRQPNQIFKQRLGSLNPFISKLRNKNQTQKKQSSSPDKKEGFMVTAKPIEEAIFDIPLWDVQKKQQGLQLLKQRKQDLKYKRYVGKVKTINEIKDYLWENKNTLKRDEVMRLAILIDKMSDNIKFLERKQKGNVNEDLITVDIQQEDDGKQ